MVNVREKIEQEVIEKLRQEIDNKLEKQKETMTVGFVGVSKKAKEGRLKMKEMIEELMRSVDER